MSGPTASTTPHDLPDLEPETRDLVSRAERRFDELLRGERVFPDRIGLVLAAGAATRFRPLTASREHAMRGLLDDERRFSVVPWNKASLPIGCRSLIDFTLADMVTSGFRHIMVNVSRLNAPDTIIRSAGDGSRFGPDVAVTYSVEDEPTGTYGGVVRMLDRFARVRPIPRATDVAIFSGDIYTEQPGYEILRAHRERDAAFTMMLNPVPDEMKSQFGTVELDEDNGIIAFHEKRPDSPSNLNNSSRYIAKSDLLMRWAGKVTPVPPDKKVHARPECFFDFGLHVFSRHLLGLKEAGFLGFPSDRMWADIGRIADFHEVNLGFLRSRVMNRVHPAARVAEGSELSGHYHVGASAVLSPGSAVSDSVVGAGWVIDGARIERSVLMPLPAGTTFRVAAGTRLDGCVVGCGDITASATGKVIVFNGDDLVFADL
jgi:NDP-sugar pyrophosphorylase family protein